MTGIDRSLRWKHGDDTPCDTFFAPRAMREPSVPWRCPEHHQYLVPIQPEPVTDTERPEPTFDITAIRETLSRRGVVRLSAHSLTNFIDLPEGMAISSIHQDPVSMSLIISVVSPDLDPVEENRAAPDLVGLWGVLEFHAPDGKRYSRLEWAPSAAE